jgi:hypothetical protein
VFTIVNDGVDDLQKGNNKSAGGTSVSPNKKNNPNEHPMFRDNGICYTCEHLPKEKTPAIWSKIVEPSAVAQGNCGLVPVATVGVDIASLLELDRHPGQAQASSKISNHEFKPLWFVSRDKVSHLDRERIIETLVDLLNTNVIPCFSDVMLAGAQLVAALTGSSNALFYVNDRVLSMEQVLADDLFNPVGLTASEANCLAQSPCVVVGSVSLVAAGAARLASIVDCVSALSCEAFGAAVAPFDAAIFENYKQHRGQLNSASNLRALLEGSMRVNTPSSKDDSVLRVFAALPQSTGPAVDAIVASAK